MILPRCPVCRHRLRSDNVEGWICSARGGCGSEFDAERVEEYRQAFYGEEDAPTPEAAAREAVWRYLKDYPDCSIGWTESAYIAQLAVEAWKKASA